ncbi:Factor-induced gene 1 protein [Nakaseomyces bracarensis]|uniref:Factor-induced gene 1 protein n=1 Tax=Nakaseomyces bracarensis TaxID=273131 RepID=A0ABR4NW47_9SACH
MFSVSLLWFALKRAPRIIVITFYFINIFLTVFLLVGCYTPSQMGTYLSKLEFNKESPLFPMIKSSFKHSPKTTGLEDMVVKMGYLHTCVDDIPRIYNLKNDTASRYCYSRKSIVDEDIYSDVVLQLFNIPESTKLPNFNSTSNTVHITLNLIELAHIASTKIIHPQLLIATIALNLLIFLGILYYLIPYLPYKPLVQEVNIAISTLLLLLWSFGVMWEHVAKRANVNLLTVASLGIVKSHSGVKAKAMSWTIFVFLLTNCIILWSVYILDRRLQESEVNLDFSMNYSSDSSSANDKRSYK